MQKDQIPKYTKLTLGGYQTFEGTTELPLGRLTFLFGPNSAGKSAVEDGFRLFSEVIKFGEYGAITGSRGFDRLKRHLRRLSDSPQRYSPYLKIGLTVQRPRKNIHSVEYISEFPISDGTFDGLIWQSVGHRIFFTLNEKPLLTIDMQTEIGLNLAHPILRTLNLMRKVDSIPSEVSNTASMRKRWLWVKGPFQIEEHGKISLLESEDLHVATEHALSVFPDFKPTIEKLVKYLFSLFNVDFSLVNASRTIPNDSDLLFFSDIQTSEDDFEYQMKQFPLPTMGAEIYRPLAESLVAKEITMQSNFFEADVYRDTSNLGELVNRALSEHLFLERGYRISAEYRLLLSRAHYAALEDSTSSMSIGDYPLLIRLFLMDSQGREFSFSDVGSGLGYVLPVLASLFDDQKVSLIQQPELHLHPALQAAMGDVLIEACNQGKQVIVETHSEHMLLRVLKRIRQTSSGQPIAEELQLKPDDVSVLYFDPGPDGSTRVKQLRVSSDGDFLDQWPRGFFAERDQELFDE